MQKFLPLLTFIFSLIFTISTLVFFGTFDPTKFPIPDVQPFYTPAVYTFFIWSVIYVWLIVGTYFIWRRKSDDEKWNGVYAPLIFSMFVGAFWAWYFQSSALIGTILIVLMWLGALLAIMRMPISDPLIGIYPLGLYLGWLSAATGVSVSTMLFEWGTMSNIGVSIAGFVVSAALSLWVIYRNPQAITITLAVVWALIGVAVENLSKGSSLILWLTILGALGIGVFGYFRFRATQ